MAWNWSNLTKPSMWADHTFGEKGIGGSGGTPEQRAQLDETGLASNQFAEWNQGGAMAGQLEAHNQREQMRKYASGQDSQSAEQLRQSLQQNQAAQMSNAAGASPQNSAMAARTGAMNMSRQGYGLAGQQATAGIQERTAANAGLNDMIMKQQQLHQQGAAQGRANAVSAYGGGNVEGTWGDKWGKSVGGLIGAAASDRRLKTDIKDGDKDAKSALSKLRSYTYDYKDEKYGKGKQFGPMAQDMEKAGLGHAVIDTPSGKMVNGAKAALSGLALTAALARRVEKLEGSKK